jgi:glycerophosphoryl diester phosphodiesterase
MMTSLLRAARLRWFRAITLPFALIMIATLSAPACTFGPSREPASALATSRVSSTAIIAHRGASGYLPEHTLAAYALAIGQGADIIEPDVVLTRDRVPICSHDTYIVNTDIMRDRFPDRAQPDGKYLYSDFDLAELKALNRPLGRNAAWLPGQPLATLDECIDLVQTLSRSLGRSIAIVPEAKAPAFHRERGMSIERELVDTLRRRGYTSRSDPAIIQCFDIATLVSIRRELGSDLRLVFLFDKPVTSEQLRDLARTIDGIGPRRTLIETDSGEPGAQPDLVKLARAAALSIYPWTLPADRAMLARFIERHQVDGFFTDFPDVGVAVRREIEERSARPRLRVPGS